MTPRLLFRIVAVAELITWAGLIAALVLRATGVTDGAVSIAGGVHGFAFLAYCVVTVFTWVDRRWSAATGLIGLAVSAVPFATLPFDLVMDRRGLLGDAWRLGPGGEAPRGPLERVQAGVLRRPIVSAAIALVAIGVVFVALLWIGPPVPRA